MKRYGNGDETPRPPETDAEFWERLIEYAETNRRLTWPEAFVLVGLFGAITFIVIFLFG